MAEKTITVIPARKRVGSRKQVTEEKPKLRVAAYCRVSTDRDEQESSYEAQVEHYTEFIDRNPEWQLAGIYADDGISGTNTKKREEFNRMIEDCMASKIDMVITKSISRFARNTLDCLKYIRKLKEKNISVYFEKENINTMDAKGEVLLTIMASLAQQESQSLSQNVKLGLQFRYQAGKVQVNHNRFLGYTKDDEGNLVIVPEEAEIVLRIYREYLEGASLFQIGQGLEADGIKTAAGSDYWLQSTLKKILTNEKYIGDAEVWNQTEAHIRQMLEELNIPFTEDVGEAAFYGPKVDINAKNVYGKEDTMITIQWDALLAEQFDMYYIDENGEKQRPYIIHRTSMGCYERTLAWLIEKYAGMFPTWLCPEQVRVIPISEKFHDYAAKVEAQLKENGIRCSVDQRSEKMGYKIREARLARVPYMLIVGAKEEEEGKVSVRSRYLGDEGMKDLGDFLAAIKEEIKNKTIRKIEVQEENK